MHVFRFVCIAIWTFDLIEELSKTWNQSQEAEVEQDVHIICMFSIWRAYDIMF